MSAQIVRSLSSILGFFESHSNSLLNTITMLITIFGESFLTDYLFRCPCLRVEETTLNKYLSQTQSNWKKIYSVVFMTIPAVSLLCFSLAVNNEARRCLSIHFRGGRCLHHFRAVKYFVTNAAICAVVAPCAWILLVFLDGRYLECCLSVIPSPCIAAIDDLPNNDTIREYVSDIRTDNQYYQTLSQVIAWSILGIGVLLMTLVMLTRPCRLNSPYYQQQFMEQFRKKEMESFHKKSEEVLSKELPKKWELFFNEASQGDWSSISELPYGDPELEKERFYYSAFHKWRREKTKQDCPYADFASGRPVSEMSSCPLVTDGIEMKPINNDGNLSA